ncbi:hypothetical protein [Helicobacter pylori]|nr:hypothetical protein [Helicobacter pylori]
MLQKSGENDSVPIEIRLHKNPITSKADSIKIQDIQFNRGNCSLI